MEKRKIVSIGLIVAMVGFVIASALVRAKRPPAPVVVAAKPELPTPKPPAKPPEPIEIKAPRPKVDIDKQATSLHDATLLGLIQNAKVAQQRGDLTTRDAMLAGLKKQRDRSRELIQKWCDSPPVRHFPA